MEMLKEEAQHEIEWWKMSKTGAPPYDYHPYAGYHGYHGYPYYNGRMGYHPYNHPYQGYPYGPGYGHLPYHPLTPEQEKEYLESLQSRESVSSPNGRGGSPRRSPRKGKSPQKERLSTVPHKNLDLTTDDDVKKYPYYYRAANMKPETFQKHMQRERVRAFDASIKTDILLSGREGSMNITYDPFHHGPYHPYMYAHSYAYHKDLAQKEQDRA